MLAISVRQPWAWLIIHAGKDIENRSWPTKVRGRVLIHAAKGMTHDEYAEAVEVAMVARAGTPPAQRVIMPSFNAMPRGGIIGSVEIVDCVTESASPWFFGRCGFVLRNPHPLAFRPFRGALGFFSVSDAA